MNNKIISEISRIQELMGVQKILIEGGPGGEVFGGPLTRVLKTIFPKFLQEVKLEVRETGVGLNKPKEFTINGEKVTQQKYEYVEKLQTNKENPTKLEKLMKDNPNETIDLFSSVKSKFPNEFTQLENDEYYDTMRVVLNKAVKFAEENNVKIEVKNFSEKDIFRIVDEKVQRGTDIPKAIEEVTGVNPNTIQGSFIFNKLKENYNNFVNSNPKWVPQKYSSISLKLENLFKDAIKDGLQKPNFILDFLSSNKTIFNFFRKTLLSWILKINKWYIGKGKFEKESIDSIFSLLNRKIQDFGQDVSIANIEKFESEFRQITQRVRILKGYEIFEGTEEQLYSLIGKELEKAGFEKKEVDIFVSHLNQLNPFNPTSKLCRGWLLRAFGKTASARYFKNLTEGFKFWKRNSTAPKEGFTVEVKDAETGKMTTRQGTVGEYVRQNFRDFFERFIIQCLTGIPKKASEYREYFSTVIGKGEYGTKAEGLCWLLVHTWFGLNVANPIISGIWSFIGRLGYYLPTEKIQSYSDVGDLFKSTFTESFRKNGITDISDEDIKNSKNPNDYSVSVKIFGYKNYFLQPGFHGGAEAIVKVLNKISRQELTYQDLKDVINGLTNEQYKKLDSKLKELNLKNMSKEDLKKFIEKNKVEFEKILNENNSKTTEVKFTDEDTEGTIEGLKKYLKSINKEYKENSFNSEQKYGVSTEGIFYLWDKTNKWHPQQN